MNSFLPFLYGASVVFLLLLAFRVMAKGFQIPSQSNHPPQKFPNSNEDRTGRITVHPEILNQNGDITDEDLLTVRFSKDSDPQ